MKIKQIFFLIPFFFIFVHSSAEAKLSFTVAQTPASVELVMGTTNNPMTFRVTNNSNAGESITTVQFNINNTYTALPNPETFVAPTGWTCTRSSSTRITCTASSSTYYIAPSSYKDFTFNINSVASTTDRIDQLANAKAKISGSKKWSNSNSTTSSWTWKSLSMTLVPSTFNVGTGCQFTLTMTVTNKSTSGPITVTSVPKPPTRTGVSATTTSTPSDLSLAANGGTDTMIWTYTAGGTAGPVTFTACASTGASCTTVSGTSKTSKTVTSSAITVSSGISCNFTAAIAVTPACLFTGDTATFMMTVTNATGSTVSNIVPSALTKCTTASIPPCAASIGTFTGPSPASIASIANGVSGTFTWTATVTGNVNDTYYVTGFATANGPIQTAIATSNPEDVDGYTVSPPSSTNAGSTNEELIWTITNNACNNINQVSIAVPAGWTPSSDGYAVVWNSAGTQVDTWTLAGTTFSSPNATDRIPPPPAAITTGDFSLVFSATPTATGNYTFNVTITDDAATPIVKTYATSVTVNPFDSSPGGPNAAGTEVWKENY